MLRRPLVRIWLILLRLDYLNRSQVEAGNDLLEPCSSSLCHTQDDQSYLVGSLLGQASDSCIVEEHVRLMHSRLVFPRKTNQR